jgi:hypothetical protein
VDTRLKTRCEVDLANSSTRSLINKAFGELHVSWLKYGGR